VTVAARVVSSLWGVSVKRHFPRSGGVCH
jgi:hypothetical protein